MLPKKRLGKREMERARLGQGKTKFEPNIGKYVKITVSPLGTRREKYWSESGAREGFFKTREWPSQKIVQVNFDPASGKKAKKIVHYPKAKKAR